MIWGVNERLRSPGLKGKRSSHWEEGETWKETSQLAKGGERGEEPERRIQTRTNTPQIKKIRQLQRQTWQGAAWL